MRSTGVPPDCERSAIQSFQSAGGDSLKVETAWGRPSAGRHETLQLDVLGPEAQHHADHEHHLAPCRCSDDRVSVLARERDRLLEEDALARGERALRVLAVQLRRQADVDGVHVRIPDCGVDISGHLGADRVGHACGPLGRLRRDRLHPHTLTERLVVRGVGRAHEAAAEDRDGDHQ